MTSTSASSGQPAADDAAAIVVSRRIEAPRRLVFEAYTDVRHLAQWWGPNGFTTTTQSFEFRAGGLWIFLMHGPDGTDYPNRITWREIVPPERIVYVHGSGPDDPDQFVSTVTFVEHAGATDVTMRAVFRSKERRDFVAERYHAVEGGRQTLGRLAEYLVAQKKG
jgi:uncharacterized protein YndB with AHSA1/START domain